MSHCPVCGSACPSDPPLCPHCGAPLPGEPPAQPEALVQLCVCPDVQAMLLTQLLTENGIPSLLHGRSPIDDLSALYTGSSFFGKRVMVSAGDLTQARALLEAFQSGQAKVLEPDMPAPQPPPAPSGEPGDPKHGAPVLLIPLIVLGLAALAGGRLVIGLVLLTAAAVLKTLW